MKYCLNSSGKEGKKTTIDGGSKGGKRKERERISTRWNDMHLPRKGTMFNYFLGVLRRMTKKEKEKRKKTPQVGF